MKSKLDELYKQRTELERQLQALDSQIDEEKKIQEQKLHENLCKQYKKSFLKDIEIFNSKEDLEKEIKFGVELRTPHYIISFTQDRFTQDRDFWQAGITDLHKSKFVVAVSLYKEEIKTVKQALDDISDTIVEYEFENKFNGVG